MPECCAERIGRPSHLVPKHPPAISITQTDIPSIPSNDNPTTRPMPRRSCSVKLVVDAGPKRTRGSTHHSCSSAFRASAHSVACESLRDRQVRRHITESPGVRRARYFPRLEVKMQARFSEGPCLVTGCTPRWAEWAWRYGR